MKNIIAFFLGWLIAAAIMLPHAHAAALATPQIAGYSSGSGMFSASAGSFSMTAANDGFIKPSVVNVGGRPVTIPATLRMASNAGQFAKNAMKLNPWAIVGTLAAGYLIDQGLEYVEGQGWLKTNPAPYPNSYGSGTQACLDAIGSTWSSDCTNQYALPPYVTDWVRSPDDLTPFGCTLAYVAGGTYSARGYNCSGGTPQTATEPVTPEDWDALPDPLPAIAPELPFSPYMPDGVPVSEPEFAPAIVPLGLPYTAPDGSTWQPKADIQPAGDGKVRVRTFDEPLTDPAGNPVPAGTPPKETATPSVSVPIVDICKDHPDIAACAKQGDVPSPDIIPTREIEFSTFFSPIGGAGSCPADVTTSRFGLTWTYQPICNFASAIRPIVVAFAWLGFGFIIVAGLKK